MGRTRSAACLTSSTHLELLSGLWPRVETGSHRWTDHPHALRLERIPDHAFARRTPHGGNCDGPHPEARAKDGGGGSVMRQDRGAPYLSALLVTCQD